MRLVDLEEWQAIQSIHPQLVKAAEAAIQNATTEDATTHTLDNLEFLRYELQKLVISIPSHRELTVPALERGREEILQLSALVFPLVKRALPSDPLLGDIWKKWDLDRYCGEEGMRYQSQSGLKLLKHPPLDGGDPWLAMLPVITAFNKTMESLFWARARQPTPSSEDTETVLSQFDGQRKILAELVLGSLQEQLSNCKKAQHLMLLQVMGQKWKPAADSLPMSLFLSTCQKQLAWQEVECSSLQ